MESWWLCAWEGKNNKCHDGYIMRPAGLIACTQRIVSEYRIVLSTYSSASHHQVGELAEDAEPLESMPEPMCAA